MLRAAGLKMVPSALCETSLRVRVFRLSKVQTDCLALHLAAAVLICWGKSLISVISVRGEELASGWA